MAKTNALTEWLGIPVSEQPPNHYRLLSLKPFASDRGKIDAAAERAIDRVSSRAGDKDKAVAKKLIGMIESARAGLMNADSKAEYDAKLRRDIAPIASPGAAIPEPLELDQIAASSNSNSVARPRKKSSSMLLPIIGGAVVPLLVYVFMFSGWFGGEQQDEPKPAGARRANNSGGSKPSTDNPSAEKNTNVAGAQQKPSVAGGKSKQPSVKVAGAGKPPEVAVKQNSGHNAKAKPKTVPTSTAAGKPVDLLSMIEPTKHRVVGKWESVGNSIVSHGEPDSCLQIPYAPPEEYQINMTVTPNAGKSGMVVGLVAGSTRFTALFDYSELYTGLYILDRKLGLPGYKTAFKGRLLESGTPAQIGCTVRKTGVTLTVNGRTVVDWKGKLSRLSPYESNYIVPNKTQLFIGGNAATYSQIELKPLTSSLIAQAKSAPRAKARPTAPTKKQTGESAKDGSLLICKSLSAKRSPIGLKSGVLPFTGPRGNGRSGANGCYFPDSGIPRNDGTVLSFHYKRSGSARGIDVVHPLGNGHVVLQIHSHWARLYAGGRWLGYSVKTAYPAKMEKGYAKAFPLENKTPPTAVVSILRRDGSYLLTFDGEPILTAQFRRANPFVLSAGFQGKGVPLTWPTGSCGLIVGPRDRGYNAATDVKLTSAKKWTRAGLAVLTPDSPTSGKLAIPDIAAQKKSEKLIRELFKDDFAKTNRTKDKLALARKLLEQGNTTDNDPAARYVLFQLAMELAIDVGDTRLTLNTVDAIVRHHDLDGLKERLAALKKLASAARVIAKGKIVAIAALENAKYAHKVEKYEEAYDFVKLARSTATKFRQRRLVDEIDELRSRILAINRWHADASEADKTLAGSPNDPKANHIKGQFLCYVKQDWSAGLPLLAKCDNAGLSAVAKRDVAAPSDGSAMAALGDAWRELAEDRKLESFAKSQWLARAAYWYGKALPNLMGLQKTLVEKRLKDIAAESAQPISLGSKKALR